MTPAPGDTPHAYAVIVAEDERLIRMVVVDALIAAGFEVREAGHAEAALAILNLDGARIHALFTDIHMPGAMDGLGLAHHVHGRWPAIVLLVTSGKAAPAEGGMPAGSRFLPKPYNPSHVITHIRELMSAR